MEILQIKKTLEEKGIKPSLHRMKILEYLLIRKNHPTVEMIFKDISSEIPTLSKTTIYNTLKTFQDCGVIQTITIEENEVRFDAVTDRHAHFKCIECGSIYDIEVDSKIFSMRSVDGHRVLESHIYLKGICKKCRKKM